MGQVFRVATYQLVSGDFSGLVARVQLRETLSANYFAMVRPTAEVTGATTAANVGMAITADPYGTGDLALADGNYLEITRGSITSEAGCVITVVECLADPDGAGFRLLSVEISALAVYTTLGGTQSVTDTSATAWKDINRIALFAGIGGGGIVSTTATAATDMPTLGVRPYPSGTATLNFDRYGVSATSTDAASITTYVVQWGTEWTVQRVTVTGTNGGAGVDATGEYDTTAISSVVRANTWVWGAGWTANDGAGDSWSGLVVTLGDGVTQLSSEAFVAVGLGTADLKTVEVYTFTHKNLSSVYAFKAVGDGASQTYDFTVAAAVASETRGTDQYSTDWTLGCRFATIGTGSTSTSTALHSEMLWTVRPTASAMITARRGDTAPSLTWAAWLNTVDFGSITLTTDASRAFRVTEYEITSGFDAATYDLSLSYSLAENYYVMIVGARGDTADPAPDTSFVRVTHDPFGTGDLSVSSADNVIRLTRTTATGDWRGVVTVVECLGDYDRNGFRLRTVKSISAAARATYGLQNTQSTVASGTWSNPDQTVVLTGARGGGSVIGAASLSEITHSHLYIASGYTLAGLDIGAWAENGGASAYDFALVGSPPQYEATGFHGLPTAHFNNTQMRTGTSEAWDDFTLIMVLEKTTASYAFYEHVFGIGDPTGVGIECQRLGSSADSYRVNVASTNVPFAMTDSAPHVLVVRRNGTTTDVFVDGVLAATATTGGTIINDKLDLFGYIGGSFVGEDYDCPYVASWQSALTDDQITTYSTILSNYYIAFGSSAGNSCFGAAWVEGSTTIQLQRAALASELVAADFTAYVIEWGSAWTVQKIITGGKLGGADVNATGDYQTFPLATSVDPDTTFVLGYGAHSDKTTCLGGWSLTVALGDGVTVSDPATTVAVGLGALGAVNVCLYVLTHASALVDWRFIASTASTSTTQAVDAAGVGESYYTSYTEGYRFALHYTASSNNADGYAATGTVFGRHTSSAVVSAKRSDGTGTWAGWVQSVDLGALTFLTASTPTEAGGPAAYLIVRDPFWTGGDNVLSVTSQGGAYAGQAVPTSTNRGNLLAVQEGAPTGSTDLEYLITRGGSADSIIGDNGWNTGQYFWRRSGESIYKGFNAYTAFRHACGSAPFSNATKYYNLCVAYSSQYRRVLMATITSTTVVTIKYRSVEAANTATWSSTTLTESVAIFEYGVATPEQNGIEMLEQADGSMLLFVSMYSALFSPVAGDILVYRSTDGGLTWTRIHTKLASKTRIGGLVAGGGLFKGAVSGDWVRLVRPQQLASAVDNKSLYTFVSPDRGASWKAITTTGGVAHYSYAAAANSTVGGFPWSVVGCGDASGTFLLACITSAGSGTVRLYSAQRDGGWSAQSALDLVYNSTYTGGGTVLTAGKIMSLCFVRTPDAIFLFSWVEGSDGSELYLHVCDPTAPLDAASWDPVGSLTQNRATLKYGPHQWKAAWCGNHIMHLAGLRDPDVNTYTNDPVVAGFMSFECGNFDVEPLGPSRYDAYPAYMAEQSRAYNYQYWHTHHGLPGPTGSANVDANTAWTKTSAGTSSQTWASDWSTLAGTSTTATWYWTYTYGVGSGQCSGGWTFEILCSAESIDPATAANMGMRFRHYSATAANRYDVSIRVGTGKLVIYDNLAAAIKSTLTVGALSTTGIELRVWLVAGYAGSNIIQVMWRPLGSSYDTAWTKDAACVINGAGAHVTGTVDIGITNAPGSGTTSTIKFRSWTQGQWSGTMWSALTATNTEASGAWTTRNPLYVVDGILARFGGSGAMDSDGYTGKIDYTRGYNNLTVDSPRFFWESSTTAQANSLIFQADTANSNARFLVNALMLIGTCDRTCTVDFNNANSWSSPAVSLTLSADLYTALRVVAVDGAAVKLETMSGAAPVRGEIGGLYLRFTASGAATGLTYVVKTDTDPDGAWFHLDTSSNLDTAGVKPGAIACVFTDRMVYRGESLNKYAYMRITFPNETTATGTHQLGAMIPGVYYDLSVPIEWSWTDNEQPNNTTSRSRGAVSWEYVEGPAQRVLSGRIVGSVSDRERDELRGMLRTYHNYSAKPIALVVDGSRPAATALYGRWSSGSQKDNAAWFEDSDGNWHEAGDLDFKFTEEP